MLNEISVKLPSQFLITEITTSFDNNFEQLSINNSFEAAKLETGPTFENNINEIKDNHLKIIISAAMNLSAIISLDENYDAIFMYNSFAAENFEPEPTFQTTLN